MSCWAIVPIKEPRACKQRLAPYLSAPKRQQLAQELLSHVIDVLTRTVGIDQIVIVSPHPPTNLPHVQTLTRARRGLNEDLTYAVQAASAQGATAVAIVSADLPFLHVCETEALLTALPARGIAIAPDHRRRGTNALAFALPAPVQLSFGPDSFQRHIDQQRENVSSIAIVQRAGLAFDVDDAADLRLLQSLRRPYRQTPVGSATALQPIAQAAL